MLNKVRQLYEFGPFRIDPEQRQLLRQNQPVPLQPKAFDILLVLVENSEKVVSKDDLMKSVWPDTFVEESNLAQHIFVLRKTLGDAVEEKRYIVTVPGRGYRFAQTVRSVALEEVDEREVAVATSADQEEQIVVASRSLAKVTIDREKTRSPRLWMAVAAVVVAILVSAGLYWRAQRKPKLTEKDTIVLADFDNKTGDPVFDGTLRQGLSAQLEQSPFLNLLSDSRIVQTLALMSQPKDARLTPELTREVCQRSASAAVLSPSIGQIGARYLLTLTAVNCSTGDSLASAQAEAVDKNHVLDALGRTASDLRSKLGESLASVQKYDVPPEDVTTSSLEALQAYSLGKRAENLNRGECLTFYQRAISLDPNFAQAYVGMGVYYYNQDDGARGTQYLRKAYELRQRVSEREKLAIETMYAMIALGDCEAAFKSEVLFTQTYPQNYGGFTNLGVFAGCLGDYDRSLAAGQQAMKLNPAVAKNYSNLIIDYLHLNRLDEARAVEQDAKNHNLDSTFAHANLYLVEFLRHDHEAMEREVAEANVGHPGGNELVLYNESDTAAYSGHFVEARKLTRQGVDVALRSDDKETAAECEAEAAVREALVGNATLAKGQAKGVVAHSNGKDTEAMAAVALGLAGDTADAARLADDLSKRFPEDTVVRYNFLPAIGAVIALAKGDPAKAVEALASATPYELGQTTQLASFVLYPVYLRAQGYLAGKQATAAAEFQKILDHPGLVVNEPIGALAHLGLGRAYVLSHDSVKAKAEYKNFLSLWKDADPDIPILTQAKAEYAKLQ
jgi:DNA-binding winged helix-turn-helix (wHTH) protein/tetratricopeptide (TPR) repeat protein